jgi:hypothetical protein
LTTELVKHLLSSIPTTAIKLVSLSSFSYFSLSLSLSFSPALACSYANAGCVKM